jgi:large subunit ribosomal protein L4
VKGAASRIASEPKTRQARELLDGWEQPRPTLVVLLGEERAAALSFRNLARVTVLAAEQVGVSDLLAAASLLASEPALQALAERASRAPRAGREAEQEAEA